MKIQKNTSKLILNKTTISKLNQNDLSALKGGTKTGITCVFCDTYASCLEDPRYCLYYETCPVGTC